MTILTNSYHNTETTTRKTRNELEEIEHRILQGRASDAEKALHRRIRNALCVAGCKCGNFWGER